jgi:hypothetical protein
MKRERALRIWDGACDPRSTVVEKYLENRGLELPAAAAGSVIRFHPKCPFANENVPAMVCLVRNATSGEPQAIYRTALTPDGQKLAVEGSARLSLGPIGGGAIKISSAPNFVGRVGVAEGFETALSLQKIPEFGNADVWCLCSSSNFPKFEPQPEVRELFIAVDQDVAGLRASYAMGQKWRASGARVFFVQSTIAGHDLNDVIRGRK